MNKFLIWIFRIIYLLLIIFIIYEVVRAIVGGTWESENIIVAALGIIMAGLFVIVGFLINQSKSIGVLEERTRNIGESLLKLGNDFKTHTFRKR
ncbi:MAG: hypothetical protein Q8N99_01245 [Nanoarchaeota archaeon]|nr:hypothetical protein [Nanoarchaeota archaeon]